MIRMNFNFKQLPKNEKIIRIFSVSRFACPFVLGETQVQAKKTLIIRREIKI